MKTFYQLREEDHKEYNQSLCEEIKRYLEEKLLILGKGGNYGNAVILAGGAGSGKSFAATNLMQGEKFKIMNPDDIKDALIHMRDNINQQKWDLPKAQTMKDVIPLLQGLNLRNPNDTGKLHLIVKGMGIEERKIALFFAGKKSATELPNVMFDMTLKDISALQGEMGGEQGVLQYLKDAGYDPNNIHIVWILTDYRVAIKQNLMRERVVPSDILFKTHRGASGTMQDIIFRTYSSLGINGDIAIILGGRETTIQLVRGSEYTYTEGPNRGKTIKLDYDLTKPVVVDFKYFRIKKAGSREISRDGIQAMKLFIKKYAPTPEATPEKAQTQAIADIEREGGKIHPDTRKALGLPT